MTYSDVAPCTSWLASQGLFVMDHTGSAPFKFQYMNFKGCSQLDFTVPAAVAWFQDRLAKSVKLGYDGMMYDFGGAFVAVSVLHERRLTLR